VRSSQVAVVGAGPAGLGAAIECAKRGAKTVVFDENARPGGQLLKQLHKFFGSSEHMAGLRGYEIGKALFEEAERLGVHVALNTVVWGVFAGGRLGVHTPGGAVEEWQFQRLVIATGATENSYAFPGWTLPGVMGAGACQTLMNVHRVMPGKRVLMVGSGNVGLIVTYQLLQAGVRKVTVIDAMPRIGGYGVHAAKVTRAGVPIWVRHTVKQAEGDSSVERAVIVEIDDERNEVPGSEKPLEVDLICLSVGLSPLVELARMPGCQVAFCRQLGGYVPLHDEDMETTVPGIYVAGDASGVEEASTALEEGRLAGVAASRSLGLISQDEAVRAKAQISSRLQGLRSGTFGEERLRAKARLMERWG
jgi:NADPH-dependent 2,4-dienoyl-CoA reductase/sulfur reductase-like enzyme